MRYWVIRAFGTNKLAGCFCCYYCYPWMGGCVWNVVNFVSLDIFVRATVGTRSSPVPGMVVYGKRVDGRPTSVSLERKSAFFLDVCARVQFCDAQLARRFCGVRKQSGNFVVGECR